MDNSSSYLGTTSQSFSFFDWVQSITWETWLIVILILAVLGFNIFYYIAQGTQDIHEIFAPILAYFGGLAADTTKQVVNTAAVGVTGTTNTLASTINTGINTAQGSPIQANEMQNANNQLSNTFAGQTSVADNNTFTANLNIKPEEQIQAVQATSSLQQKEGWCYIGEEQEYRSCASVGVNDTCMSGDIFPTRDICINPNLRQ